MRILIRLLALGALLVMSQKGHALACRSDSFDGGVDAHIDLNTTVAISKSMSKGTVVWRSPETPIRVVCWMDGPANAESVHFYLSPLDPSGMDLGDDLEVGIGLTINGQTREFLYSANSGKVDLSKMDTGFMLPSCNRGQGCKEPWQIVDRMLSFNFFFAKKSPASNQPSPEGGSVTTRSTYRVFQLDGAGGLTNKAQGNYNMTVWKMDNLRYINCNSTIALSSPTINFGGINKAHAQRDHVAGEKPFSITAHKDCDSAYGLGAFLKPINGSVNKAKEMLIPDDNHSIGITLHDKDNNQSLVPFNQEFELVKHSTDRTVARNFIARATWLTDSANAKLGKFNAGATIDIYYK